MRKTQALFFILSFTTLGCEQNITLDIPKYDDKVAVYCILQPDTIPIMYLNLSKSYYEYGDTTGNVNFIKDAQVYITDQTANTKDSLKLDSLYITQGMAWFYKGKNRSQIGHHYIATINYHGKIINAETTVPEQVAVDHFNYIKSTDSTFGNYYTDYSFNIYFNDIPGMGNYYTITQYFSFGDVGQTDYADYTSDLGFDGKQLDILYDYDQTQGPPPTPPFTVWFTIDNVTKEAARYFTDVYTQGNSAQDPFSQPVVIESNVNGGLGIFGALTPSPKFFVQVTK